MNNKVAKRLRRIAEEKTKGNYNKARVYVSDERGTIWLVADCTRGTYVQSKKIYKNKYSLIPSKRNELTKSIKSLIVQKEKTHAIL